MKKANKRLRQILSLKNVYLELKKGKESLMNLLDEAELSESVYNSNAIENSTLTLLDTEKIILDMEVSSNFSLREIYEAKNLARVYEYFKSKKDTINLNKDTILFLHKMLISGIDDKIAGRFREKNEYVRIGSYIAEDPQNIESEIYRILSEYKNIDELNFLEKITRFHLDFENIHPFVDGNGRIGRVLINLQLQNLNLPNIIVRDKEKEKYYSAFKTYRVKNNLDDMVEVLYLALSESLNKRIGYLQATKIVKLSEYAKQNKLNLSALINKARRQTIPAFREKGVWKISN